MNKALHQLRLDDDAIDILMSLHESKNLPKPIKAYVDDIYKKFIIRIILERKKY